MRKEKKEQVSDVAAANCLDNCEPTVPSWVVSWMSAAMATMWQWPANCSIHVLQPQENIRGAVMYCVLQCDSYSSECLLFVRRSHSIWCCCQHWQTSTFTLPRMQRKFWMHRLTTSSVYGLVILCVVLIIRCYSDGRIRPRHCPTNILHDLTGIWKCLQCFDAVGWAAGRASDL